MPLPEPEPTEKRSDFLNRCMSDEVSTEEFPSESQRYAICVRQWESNTELDSTALAESYNDYPEAASNNAKRALKYKAENPDNKCGTPVGWARANQLAKRENISRETIARMASFKRHQQSRDVPYSEGCGGLMWDAWGGSAGINWAISKLKQIDKKKNSMTRKFAFGAEPSNETRVNKEAGTMTSVALISVGPALGHGLFVDAKSLETIAAELGETKLPAYITHRGAIFDDRLTREIGYFERFRIEDDRLLGDFQAFESFQEDETKKYKRLFELAEKMPERFGLSIVFSANAVWATPNGDIPLGRSPSNDSDRLYDENNPPEDALFEYPSIRVEEVSSADFVDSPAANERGLFSHIDKPNTYKMTKADLLKLNEELEEQNKALALRVTESESKLEELQLSLEEDKEKELEEHEEEAPEAEEDESDTPEAEAPEAEEDESDAPEADESEEDESEDEESMSLEDKIGELEKEIESKMKEIEDLKAQLEDKDQEMQSKSTELSSKISALEALIQGSEVVKASFSDEVYRPSKSNRDKIISEFAHKNHISEFAATLRLGKERPELFKV